MALALYRKYRPRTFAEVIGQEHVTEPLSQALRSGRLNHAYLFSGPRGCGKTSSARILARSLNCEQGPTPEPCGVCQSCRSLANDGAGSIDVIEIDAASHGGVDDARELREKAFFAPASSRYKIYVIDEAHMVSSAGFNALLKLVEEPPEYVKFIFATTEPEKVLGTIRSRTHHYPFRLIPPAVLRPYLQQLTEAEGVSVEPAVFPLVVRAGGGSARDSLSVLDQLIAGAGPDGVSYARAVALLGVTDVTLLDEMCDALAAGDGAAAYSTIDRVAEAGHDPRRFASDLLERFRDLIVLQQVPDAVDKGLIDGPTDQLEAMSAQAARLGPATLSRCADIVHNGLVEMRGTTAPRLLLELITARMLLPGAEDSTGALLQRLERMERRLTLSGDSPVRGEPEPAPPISSGADAAPANAPVSAPGGGGLSAARAAAAAAAGRRAGAGAAPGRRPAGQTVPAAPGQPTPVSPEAAQRVSSEATQPGPVPSEAAQARPEPAAVAPSVQTPVPAASAPQQSPPAAAPSSGRPVGGAADHDDEPPWDDEPEPDDYDSPPTSAAAPAGGSAAPANPSAAPASALVASASPSAASAGAPDGIMPDAPEEPGAAAVEAAVPGQLTAAAVREVWPEVIAMLGRQSKRLAALARDAVVRDLQGETLVLTFQHAKFIEMITPGLPAVANVLYEVLGGRWEVRCEVADQGGGSPAPAPRSGGRGGPGQGSPGRVGPGQGSPGQGGAGQAGQGHSGAGNDGGRGGSPGQSGPSQGGPIQSGPIQSGPGNGGGRDSVRNTVAGARPERASASGAHPAQAAAARPPQSRRQAEAPASSGDDDWPEPVRPGGLAPPASTAAPVDDDEEWPEVRPIGMAAGDAAIQAPQQEPAAGARGDDPRSAVPADDVPSSRSGNGGLSAEQREGTAQEMGLPGGSAPGISPPGQADATASRSRAATGAGDAERPAPTAASDSSPAAVPPPVGNGTAGSAMAGNGTASNGTAGNGTAGNGTVGNGTAGNGTAGNSTVGNGTAGSATPGSGTASSATTGNGPAASARAAAAAAAAAAGRAGRNAGPGGGLAAARAAAAAARQAATRSGPAAATTPTSAWSDGSPAEEAPYDPEFDGPPAGKASAFEGFDPGDEPLDEVIDEKTARESSEQQAMRLLQEAFGAEKIGES